MYRHTRKDLIERFRPIAESRLSEKEPQTLKDVQEYADEVLSQNRKMTSVILDIQDAIEERMLDSEPTVDSLNDLSWLASLLEKGLSAYKANASMLVWCSEKRIALILTEALQGKQDKHNN